MRYNACFEDKKRKQINFLTTAGNVRYFAVRKSKNAGIFKLYKCGIPDAVRKVQYSQFLIKKGFKVFDHNKDMLVRGVETLRTGYELKTGPYKYQYCEGDTFYTQINKGGVKIAEFGFIDPRQEVLCELDIKEGEKAEDILGIFLGVFLCFEYD